MPVTNAWRFECCNVLLNALCDEERASLQIQVIPYSRRGSVGKTVTTTVTNEGRILASCRHETSFLIGQEEWIERARVLMYHALG